MSTRHEVSSAMDFLTTDVILLFSHFAAGFTLLSFILLPILISFRCWVYFLVSHPTSYPHFISLLGLLSCLFSFLLYSHLLVFKLSIYYQFKPDELYHWWRTERSGKRERWVGTTL